MSVTGPSARSATVGAETRPPTWRLTSCWVTPPLWSARLGGLPGRRGANTVTGLSDMFTGIIEETGRVERFERAADAWKLRICARVSLTEVVLGDSIAVNGCCLTVVAFDDSRLEFDVLEETRRVTSLAALGVGGVVNLERSLRFGGKLGGHFVTGHVDGVGIVEVFEARGADRYLRVRAPARAGRYLIHKGSIAIDGISLTVAEIEAEGDGFAVWLIPHTVAVTNLRDKKAGDPVNLEFDLLGKYVERLTHYGRFDREPTSSS